MLIRDLHEVETVGLADSRRVRSKLGVSLLPSSVSVRRLTQRERFAKAVRPAA